MTRKSFFISIDSCTRQFDEVNYFTVLSTAEREADNFMKGPSENDQSSSDVEDENKSQTSETFPKHEWMKHRIKILKQEVRIAEMKTEIIKHEINNSRDLRQLQKKHKTYL